MSQGSSDTGGSDPLPIYYDPSQRKPSTDSSMLLRFDEPSVADLRYAKTCTPFKSV